MLIEIKQEDSKKVLELLKNNDIEHQAYDNHYWAVCREEIVQSIDSSISLEDKSFYDVVGDKADDIIYKLTETLYNSRLSEYAFDRLSEIAMDIVNERLKELN